MTIEAVVAIGAGVAAGSVLLTAFGLDSVIELISGAVLVWRLQYEVAGASAKRVESVERQTTRISAVLHNRLYLNVPSETAFAQSLACRPGLRALPSL